MIQTSNLDIQNSFDKSLVGKPIFDVAIDISEVSIDNLINNEFIKNVPIVKTIAGFVQAGVNIHDRLFLKKLLTFLQKIYEIPECERKKMIDDIKTSSKYRIKVGEKLLYLLDSCDDYESSELLARLFSAALQGYINYDEFLKASHVIVKNQASTILNFAKTDNDVIDMYENDVDIETGLYVVHSEKISVDVRENDDYDAGKDYVAEVGDGGLWASPSEAGSIIKKVFAEGIK